MGFALVAAMLVMGARWLLPKLQARTPKGRERAAFRALLKACYGDDRQAQRLIFGEMERDPSLGFGQAAKRARRRLERDRRN